MSTEVNSVNAKQKIEVDAEKRAFMKKFGKYAAVGVGMSVLMGPGVSTANAYDYIGTNANRRNKVKAKIRKFHSNVKKHVKSHFGSNNNYRWSRSR